MYIRIIILILSLLIITQVKGQEDFRKHGRFPERIAELEKIKLIESLDMDEETTLRFFSRRAEHQKKVESIESKLDSTINELNQMLNSENEINDEKYKNYIGQINSLHLVIDNERGKFFNSLNDILSYRQIAKLIVFERNFREELRKAIFKERKFRKPD